jgi:hypothetical protein
LAPENPLREVYIASRSREGGREVRGRKERGRESTTAARQNDVETKIDLKFS